MPEKKYLSKVKVPENSVKYSNKVFVQQFLQPVSKWLQTGRLLPG